MPHAKFMLGGQGQPDKTVKPAALPGRS